MFPAYSFILIFFYIWKYKNIYITILLFPYIFSTKGVFLVKRKKGWIIDSSEIGFEAPGEIKGNLVEGFSFTNEPVQFTHTAPDTTEKPKVGKQKSKKNNTDILDMRKLSIVNGLPPPIDGEKLEYKRCYMLRFSTLKKLEQIKAMHPDIVYVSSIVDMAINHYFHCLIDNE